MAKKNGAAKSVKKPLLREGLSTMGQGKTIGSGGDAKMAGNLDGIMGQGNSKKRGTGTTTPNLQSGIMKQ